MRTAYELGRRAYLMRVAQSGLALADFKLRPAFLGGKKIPYNFTMLASEEHGDGLRQLAAWLAEGKVKSVVDSEYSFDKVHEAYAKIMSHRAKGKVVVNVA